MQIKFTIPYLPELSKNKRYAYFRSKIKNPHHKQAQNTVYYTCLQAMGDKRPIQKQKYEVCITWYRKNMRGDLQNFINPIIDAIKLALRIDDNYATLGKCDWHIDKMNPRMEITINFTGTL